MRNAIRFAIFALVAFCAAHAQFDSGQIAGFVRDPSQSVDSGRQRHRDQRRQRRETPRGHQQHRLLRRCPTCSSALIRVEVEAPGFKKSVQSGIQLSAAAKLSIDIELTVGAVTDSVEVSAAATLVQSETATVGRTVETKQIENLTMNGRNPIYLALLKPGVIGGSIGTFDPDSVSNGGFSINGARADEYVVTVDGAVATRTRSSGSMLGAQDVDTVQEVQILTANFNAEYGRSSGGQIRFVTKSGTTRFPRRSGRELPQLRARRQYLDAQPRHRPEPLLDGPQPFRFNQFGFDINGPVFIPHKFNADRNKLFFLYAEEWTRRRDDSTNTYTVPTAAMRRRRSERPAEPVEPVLRPRPHRHRSRHQAALSRQHHSGQPDQPQRPRAAERLSSSDARDSSRGPRTGSAPTRTTRTCARTPSRSTT